MSAIIYFEWKGKKRSLVEICKMENKNYHVVWENLYYKQMHIYEAVREGYRGKSKINKGDQFSKLLVISNTVKITKTAIKRNYYLCRCECGEEKQVRADHLKNGSIKSCGCLHRKLSVRNFKDSSINRTKHYVMFNGIRMSISLLAKTLGLKYNILYKKLTINKMSVNEAINYIKNHKR
jgi:hypothetical protein